MVQVPSLFSHSSLLPLVRCGGTFRPYAPPAFLRPPAEPLPWIGKSPKGSRTPKTKLPKAPPQPGWHALSAVTLILRRPPPLQCTQQLWTLDGYSIDGWPVRATIHYHYTTLLPESVERNVKNTLESTVGRMAFGRKHGRLPGSRGLRSATGSFNPPSPPTPPPAGRARPPLRSPRS
jgi:hypothetical protein